ncbi:MAG: hypothetical protein IPK82_28240 [Polyangiaceae bacterium]|nr:hypothetical protein [Polyangiaceae bacterium]
MHKHRHPTFLRHGRKSVLSASDGVRLAAFCAAMLGILPSCSKADPVGTSPAGSASSSAAPNPNAPPPKTVKRTTSGSIAVSNLNGQIQTLEKGLTAPDPNSKRARFLIDLWMIRAEMAGQLADLEKAAEAAERLPIGDKDPVDNLLTRASVRSAVHLFDASLGDLDEAEKRGAPASKTRSTRVAVLAARGQVAEALTLAQTAAAESPRLESLGVYAVLLSELGRRDEAVKTFREAFDKYTDTSPFPVAWLFFRQGQFWEREGQKDLAIAYYEAAVERVPSYGHAAAHAARFYPPDKAETFLRGLVTSADDPELKSVLAQKLFDKGDRSGAEKLVREAAERYDNLVARHPAAFSDHAAQFWLDAGGDASKALALARQNLTYRKTARSYELAILAAISANDKKAACELGMEGQKAAKLSPIVIDVATGACK